MLYELDLHYSFPKSVNRHFQKCDVSFIHCRLTFLPTHGNGTVTVLGYLEDLWKNFFGRSPMAYFLSGSYPPIAHYALHGETFSPRLVSWDLGAH
jgi:hypothetical protein